MRLPRLLLSTGAANTHGDGRALGPARARETMLCWSRRMLVMKSRGATRKCRSEHLLANLRSLARGDRSEDPKPQLVRAGAPRPPRPRGRGGHRRDWRSCSAGPALTPALAADAQNVIAHAYGELDSADGCCSRQSPALRCLARVPVWLQSLSRTAAGAAANSEMHALPCAWHGVLPGRCFFYFATTSRSRARRVPRAG